MPEYEDAPEEVRAFIDAQVRAVDHAYMEADVIKKDLMQLFNTMPLDQARALRRLFTGISHNPGSAIFYDGLLAGIMAGRFGVCAFCSGHHDEEDPDEALKAMTEQARPLSRQGGDGDQSALIEDFTKGVNKETFRRMFPGKAEQLDLLEDDPDWRVASFDFDHENPSNEIIAAISRIAFKAPPMPLGDLMSMLAEEWHLDDMWAGEEGEYIDFQGWICTDCKRQVWASIQDRMLSPKGLDGCPGCRLKSAHG